MTDAVSKQVSKFALMSFYHLLKHIIETPRVDLVSQELLGAIQTFHRIYLEDPICTYGITAVKMFICSKMNSSDRVTEESISTVVNRAVACNSVVFCGNAFNMLRL